MNTLADHLWGKKAKLIYLLIASAFMLFTLLGAREIWTQEHRWADIVAGMFYRHDFLHPFLGQSNYYDKPLLSYWFIAFFAKISGALTTFTLRLPSVLAGLLAMLAIYRLGMRLKDRELGLLSGWLLLTTFYFIFWARTSSADMLNLAGSLFAISWYFDHEEPSRHSVKQFLNYVIFFIILAFTSLCKGLVGAIVPCIVILVDILLKKTWKRYLHVSLLASLLPGLLIYLLPFWASSHFGNHSYQENGLYLVYRENVLRYFQPFDHKAPIYTYFIYLPIYLLPWTFFFIGALITLRPRWPTLSLNSRWIVWSLLALFLFFTLSGSRRSYYILPLVPFAILFTADWLLTVFNTRHEKSYLQQRLAYATLGVFVLFFIILDLAPAWYYSRFGVSQFAMVLKTEASKMQPWNHWNIVMLDAESKLNFYLQLSPGTLHLGIKEGGSHQQTAKTLLEAWPLINNKPTNTIFITRKAYAVLLKPYFSQYHLLMLSTSRGFLKNHYDEDMPAAFIPNK